ncbi:unnamed protein product [Ambrosiozyma monospora]|uniref:Unnamed protein product n=1 Tax=Ambrosiozyma monospora TaxID=43982 RepID=A0ACB5T641_AMBMO|nr:unnamed protein product [Ambrosiozyma monospora]
MSFDNNLEGYTITHTMWNKYWDNNDGSFRCHEACNGSMGGKFNVWSMGVALNAIGDSCVAMRDYTLPIVEPAVKAAMKYRNKEKGGFSAFYHGGYQSGDNDIYYDDDEHLLRGFIACYEGTGNHEYLEISKDLMRFIMTGLVTHEKFGCKCMKWHINKNYVASISNGAGAVCAGK